MIQDSRLFIVIVLLALPMAVAQAVVIDMVPVGNTGNTGNSADGYGAVDYAYNIGTYEVTAGQYTEFLNDVAATDPYGLFNFAMYGSRGCRIIRGLSSTGYSYSVAGEYANRPVNFVSWYDAARFANWMTTGDTESGVYDTSTWVALDHETAAVTLGVNMVYFIPTEDEWYKAAYHKNDGDTGNYFSYPTSSDAGPNRDMTEALRPGNNANFTGIPFPIDFPYYLTVVGEFELSKSPYGTFDQGGNVWEWNETIISSGRGLRGGSFASPQGDLHRFARQYLFPNREDERFGFRLASVKNQVIPEPSTFIVWSLLGGLGIIGWWRRRRRSA
jgi:formylglycine-generating enzyme required for sulfatase activity